MRFLFFILLSLITFQGNAQEKFSYVGERIIDDPTDLIGYNFRPFKMEVPGDYEPTMIEAGTYSFGITRSRLYVSGNQEIRGLYEINNISPAIYGYKVALLNPSNPNSRGHFKVILNKYKEVEVVIFKAESKTTEYIFHLPDPPKNLLEKEKKYFTDLGEIQIENPDSLWGKQLVPYFTINQIDKIQNRIYGNDSTIISFEEVITIKEKKKKGKRKRKKKKKEEVPTESKKTEATQSEKTDEPEQKNQKIIKKYFVKIQTFVKNNEGVMEKRVREYPVRKIEEREDITARKNEERFQVAIQISKRKEIYLYLNGDRSVSSFEAEGMRYMMRGH